jgi:hypothetical protein
MNRRDWAAYVAPALWRMPVSGSQPAGDPRVIICGLSTALRTLVTKKAAPKVLLPQTEAANVWFVTQRSGRGVGIGFGSL